MVRNCSSLATSQRTGIMLMAMPPCGSNGWGARRVQMTKPSGAGSPDAIPSVNGLPRHELWARTMAGAATRAAVPVTRRWRRVSMATTLSTDCCGGESSDVELEVEDVAVLHDIFLAF